MSTAVPVIVATASQPSFETTSFRATLVVFKAVRSAKAKGAPKQLRSVAKANEWLAANWRQALDHGEASTIRLIGRASV